MLIQSRLLINEHLFILTNKFNTILLLKLQNKKTNKIKKTICCYLLWQRLVILTDSIWPKLGKNMTKWNSHQRTWMIERDRKITPRNINRWTWPKNRWIWPKKKKWRKMNWSSWIGQMIIPPLTMFLSLIWYLEIKYFF